VVGSIERATGWPGFEDIDAYTLGDAARRRNIGGVIDGLKPQTDGTGFVGRALTARVEYQPNTPLPLGNYGAAALLDRVAPGDVVILDGGGRMLSAFGDLAIMIIQRRGGIAAIVNAAVRDVEDIDPGFPLFARGVAITSIASHGFITGVGEPVHIEGIKIETGDLVAGCRGGIATVPANAADAVRAQALEIIESDRLVREGLDRGESMGHLWQQHKTTADGDEDPC
jgi:regulator of RNase E activity RraA